MLRPASSPSTPSCEQLAARHGIDLGRELTTGYAARLIRHKAKQISRRAGFSRSDIDDIQQRLIERVLENLPAFDPAQGHFNVFVKTVVERYSANLVRDAQAEKRDRCNTSSFSTVVDEDQGESLDLGDKVGRRELDSRLGIATRDPHEAIELAQDLADCLARLPADLQDLCQRLQRASISEVARELGMPRTTLYEVIAKLRRQLAGTDLGQYR